MTLTRWMAKVDLLLEERRAEFVEALRAVLVDRTFPPHPRFRGVPQPIDASDELCAIHLLYDLQDFGPVACGMSKRAGWKFGGRSLLRGGGEFVEDVVWRSEFDSPDEQREVSLAAHDRFVEWVRSGWSSVRSVAPDLAGYLSPPDSQRVRDLDTGRTVSLSDVGFGFR